MKSSTKRFTGSVATLATLASVVAPVVANAETMTVARAKELVDYAVKTKVFAECNIAYAAILQLPAKDQPALLAQLAPAMEASKTPEITAIIDGVLKQVATEKGLDAYYDAYAQIQKVAGERNVQYLLGELDSWGRAGVFTPEIVDATNAIIAAQKNPTVETVTAAKAAAAKVTNAGSLKWLNTEIVAVEKLVSLTVTKVAGAGAKTIKVTFNKPVEDTTKLALTVKRDNVTVNVVETKWNDAKTEATLTASYALQTGSYTVTSKYDTADAVTSTATNIEASKVDKIVFTTENAVVNSAKNAISANIKVLNQYGEDLTSSISASDLSISSSKGNWDQTYTSGKINITNTSYEVGDKVVLTAVYKPTATVSTATLTVAQTANISSITIGDVTTDNTTLKGKDIFVNTTVTGNYYLPLTVKDQYGNTLKAADLQGLTMISSDKSIINLGSIVDLNGVTVLNLQDGGYVNSSNVSVPETYGTAVITLVSSNGVSANKNVTVKENGKVDVFNVSAPTSQVIQNEEVTLPFTSADQYGVALVKASDFGISVDESTTVGNNNGSNTDTELNINGVKISATGATLGYKVDYANDGALVLKVKPSASATNVVITVITPTGKVQTLTLAVDKARVFTNIAGLKSDMLTALQVGQSSDDLSAKLLLKDQYGKVTTGASNLPTGWTIAVSAVDGSASNVTVASTTTSKGAVFTAVTKGTEAFKVTMKDASGNTVDEYTLNIEAVDSKDIQSYAINDLNKQYVTSGAAATYNQTVSIYGLKGTTKVKVDQGLIKSVVSTNGIATSGSAIIANNNIDTDNADKTAKLTVLVEGYNGLVTLTKDLVYSSAKPVASTVALYQSNGSTAITDAAYVASLSSLNGLSIDMGYTSTTAAAIRFKFVDQYAQTIKNDGSYVITNVSNTSGTAVSVDANGVLTATGFVAGDSFTITAITSNGLTKSIKVIIGQ